MTLHTAQHETHGANAASRYAKTLVIIGQRGAWGAMRATKRADG